MAKEATKTQDYLTEYLPWAKKLIRSQTARGLIAIVQADRVSITNSTTVFQPSIEKLTSPDLELAIESNKDQADSAKLVANFEESTLAELILISQHHFFVGLNPQSETWPIRYGDNQSRKLDQIVKAALLREKSDRFVQRSGAAMLRHLIHRVPIGSVPEDYIDWTIDESELEARTLNALVRAGIETYGDLAILSENQLLKISGLGEAGLDDIRKELISRGWHKPGADLFRRTANGAAQNT